MYKNLTAAILASGLLLPTAAFAASNNQASPPAVKSDKADKTTSKSHHKTSQKSAKTGDKAKDNAKHKASKDTAKDKDKAAK